MKKIIFILTVLLLLLVGVIFMSERVQRAQNIKDTPEPTLNPTIATMQKGLYVVATDPYNNSKVVPIESSIVIEFSRKPLATEFKFEIIPHVDYTGLIEGKNFLALPRSPLSPDTDYRIKITFPSSNLTREYAFHTLREGQLLSDTRDSDVHEQQEEYELKNDPDIYVAGFTPYEESQLSVISDYAYKPNGHYVFYVESKTDRTSAQAAFITWLKSLKLNDSQIESLDILYR